jgi:hypothetical protein
VVAGNDDGGGGALFGPGKEFRIFREGQVPRLGAVGQREALERRLGVSKDLTFQVAGDFSGSEKHGGQCKTKNSQSKTSLRVLPVLAPRRASGGFGILQFALLITRALARAVQVIR